MSLSPLSHCLFQFSIPPPDERTTSDHLLTNSFLSRCWSFKTDEAGIYFGASCQTGICKGRSKWARLIFCFPILFEIFLRQPFLHSEKIGIGCLRYNTTLERNWKEKTIFFRRCSSVQERGRNIQIAQILPRGKSICLRFHSNHGRNCGAVRHSKQKSLSFKQHYCITNRQTRAGWWWRRMDIVVQEAEHTWRNGRRY